MAKFVTVSENANIFHDPFSGLTIARGEVKELALSQLASKRVRTALASGHLVYAEPPVKEGEKKAEVTVEELEGKFLELASTEEGKAKLVKSFNLDQLKALATHYGFELEATDTKASLVESILSELS